MSVIGLNEADLSAGIATVPMERGNGSDHNVEGFELLDLEQIKKHGIPSVPWNLPGWLVEQDITLFAGDPYTGKTTTAGALALALATGGDWCGSKRATNAGVVLGRGQSDQECAIMFCRLGAPHPTY
jgi:hypothetical protein